MPHYDRCIQCGSLSIRFGICSSIQIMLLSIPNDWICMALDSKCHYQLHIYLLWNRYLYKLEKSKLFSTILWYCNEYSNIVIIFSIRNWCVTVVLRVITCKAIYRFIPLGRSWLFWLHDLFSTLVLRRKFFHYTRKFMDLLFMTDTYLFTDHWWQNQELHN